MSRPAVFISGGAKRIGAELSRAFGAAGWHVVIHYGGSREAAEELAAVLPSAETVQCDLANANAAVAMIEALAERLDDWRVLVNSAAVFPPDTARAIDPEVLAKAMRINLETPTRMTQAFLAQAKVGGGCRAIQFLDQKIANPNPDFFSYTLAKNAFAAAVKLLAMAQANPADRVYGLAPGAMLPSHDQEASEHENSGRMNLLNRLTKPHELAEAALFLADGWLASGETLFIDSGQHLLAQPRDVLYLARGES